VTHHRELSKHGRPAWTFGSSFAHFYFEWRRCRPSHALILASSLSISLTQVAFLKQGASLMQRLVTPPSFSPLCQLQKRMHRRCPVVVLFCQAMSFSHARVLLCLAKPQPVSSMPPMARSPQPPNGYATW
jgi:hypothetical protein